MNRTRLAELVTILAGVATVVSGAWSFYFPGQKQSIRLEGFGVHSMLADELAGKIELTDEQIDQLAALKIKSIQELRPLVHQLCADIRQLKTCRSAINYKMPALMDLERRVLKDKEVIMERDIKEHETVSRMLGS